MIQILTDNRQVKGHISVLTRDLGYEPVFHETAATLLSQISVNTGTAATTAVLLDVDIATKEEMTKAIQSVAPTVRKIAFQLIGQATPIDTKPEGVDYFFLLPSNAERAKARLKTALRGSDSVMQSDRGNTRSGFTSPATPRRFTRTAAPFKTKNPFSSASVSNHAMRADSKETRYLVANSLVARNLISQMHDVRTTASLLILAGNEGADFETVAREFNYQNNRDQTQLLVVDADDISLEMLEKTERAASKIQKQTICYVGKTENLSDESVEVLKLFVEYLSNLRNPHMRIVMAHEYGSEPFLRKAVVDYVKETHNVRPTILVPDLKDRKEDISPIALNLLSSLRTAHPFLQVKNIEESALSYLIEQRAHYSEAKLVRVLRNCIALCQRPTMQIEDIKNYGEHNATTSHLMESMADEAYFPSSHTA